MSLFMYNKKVMKENKVEGPFKDKKSKKGEQNLMKKRYFSPMAEVIILSDEDVITTSGTEAGRGTEGNLDGNGGGHASESFPT